MRRIWLAGLAAATIAGALVFAARETLVLGWFDLRTPKAPLSAREAMLEPHIRYYPPTNGTAPYPAVLQFHGCGGMRPDFQEQWARVANDAGYMAVVVNSYAGRGITRERALKTVCEGKELIGQERAGDVAAALDIVSRRPEIDPGRVVLAGWSHGAWSIMDFVALATAGRSPSGVSGPHARAPEITGLILFYPHCGLGAWTKVIGWKAAYPTLALIAGKDSVVDPKACPRIFERLHKKYAQIGFHVYPDADHAFDDPNLPAGWRHLYGAAEHADATQQYAEFLATVRE